MKLIKQYCYLDDQDDFSEIGIKKFIEKQAKTCYQSTHTITEDSYEKFVQRMIDSDHSRTLEMGTVHLKMSRPIFASFICIFVAGNEVISTRQKEKPSVENN